MVLLPGIAIAGCLIWWLEPTTTVEWLRAASATLSVTTVLLIVISTTSFWRLFWFFIKPLNWWVFPDLNGDWEVSLHSNVGEIAQKNPDLKKQNPKSNVSGVITIKQSLLKTVTIFRSNDGYSDSETTFVNLIHTPNSSRFKLAYVYENNTPQPHSSDEQRHFGAAEVEIRWDDGDLVAEGLYWTNRRWSEGLNTAGKISMKRKK